MQCAGPKVEIIDQKFTDPMQNAFTCLRFVLEFAARRRESSRDADLSPGRVLYTGARMLEKLSRSAKKCQKVQ